jgi:hypothetical protein
MKVLAVLLIAVGLAAAGCAGSAGKHATTAKTQSRAPGPSPLVVAVYPKLPQGIDLRKGAAFLSPTRLVIMSWGSGNCPNVPKRLAVVNPSSIRIRLGLRKPANGICFADLRSIPVVVAIDPNWIDVHRPLTIRFYGGRNGKPLGGRNGKPFLRVAPPLRG